MPALARPASLTSMTRDPARRVTSAGRAATAPGPLTSSVAPTYRLGWVTFFS
jgi:hypothetical protein